MKSSLAKTIAIFLAGALSVAPCASGQTQKFEATTTTTTTEGTVTEFGPQGVVIKTEPGEQPVRYLSNETTNYVDEAGTPLDASTIKSGTPVEIIYTKVGDTLIASKIVVRKARSVPAREPTRVVVPGTAKVVPAPAVVERTEVQVTPPPTTVAMPAPVPGLSAVPRDRLETSTLTTTRWGTVTGFGQDTIILQADSTPEPLPYLVTKKTTYVDEAGTPIMADSIRRGDPVTIYSLREGDRLVASRVIVKKSAVAPPVEKPGTTIVTPAPADAPGVIIEKKTTTTTTRK